MRLGHIEIHAGKMSPYEISKSSSLNMILQHKYDFKFTWTFAALMWYQKQAKAEFYMEPTTNLTAQITINPVHSHVTLHAYYLQKVIIFLFRI